MPAAGGVNITKKLRMMEFWSPIYDYVRHRTYRTYSAPDWTTWMDCSCSSLTTKGGFDSGLGVGYEDGVTGVGDSTMVIYSLGGIFIDDLPNGVIVNQANLMLKFSRIENTTSELSYFDTPTAFTYAKDSDRVRVDRFDSTPDITSSLANMDAITLTDDMVKVSSDGNVNGGGIISNVDIKKVVSCNGYYYLHWRDMFTTGELKFHDFQFGIRVVFK